jgi:two-component system response regulator YesN
MMGSMANGTMTKKHLLLVDDDADLAGYLAEVLSWVDEDYRIITSGSGEEALDQLHRGRVDLVITDLRMPGIDGLMLVRWLRAFHPRMPAILMTGDTRREVYVKARHCGAWRTIPKSGDFPRELERAVREALSASDGPEDGRGRDGGGGPKGRDFL